MNLKTLLQPLCLTATLLAWTAAAPAQTYSIINYFNTNTDGFGGQSPQAGLTLVGNTLYGTTYGGGTNGIGVIYQINTNGTGYNEFYSFSALDDNGFNPDGANPVGELVASGNILYGVTQFGGTNGQGAVFSVNSDGTGFTTLYSFNDANVVSPVCGLLLDGTNLFGVTPSGGQFGNGGLFKLNTDGSGYTNFYSFTGVEGDSPSVELVISGDTLFGTAYDGPTQPGGTGDGTVFSVDINGNNFSNLVTFTTPTGSAPRTNQYGAYAPTRLVLADGTLYGTTSRGGGFGQGTLYLMRTDGSDFGVLYNLPGTKNNGSFSGPLLLVGNTLYGTTFYDGITQNGTVFRYNTSGGKFEVLHDFLGGNDGANPVTSLALAGNSIYGTASVGGLGGSGTIFAESLVTVPIPLYLQATGNTVTLNWTDPSFVLQSSPTASGGYTNVPNATPPYMTSAGTGAAFFRLVKQNAD